MLRVLSTTTLALVLFLAATACSSPSHGPTVEFEARTPRTIFVLAPPTDQVSGQQAEAVRSALMSALRERGFGVSSAADARMVPVVLEWGAEVKLSAQLLDAEQRVLWEDRGAAARSKSGRRRNRRSPEELAVRAVRELLRSLPPAASED